METKLKLKYRTTIKAWDHGPNGNNWADRCRWANDIRKLPLNWSPEWQKHLAEKANA